MFVDPPEWIVDRGGIITLMGDVAPSNEGERDRNLPNAEAPQRFCRGRRGKKRGVRA
jgi:hypothetical protein